MNAVVPYQIEIESEFGLVLVLVRLDVPEHSRQVHRSLDDW